MEGAYLIMIGVTPIMTVEITLTKMVVSGITRLSIFFTRLSYQNRVLIK